MGLTRPPALQWRRLPVLGLSVVALLAGLTGALVLLGVPMPAGTLPLAATHGVLMTLGFLGTLIALERAVALGRTWGYAAPLGAGLGAMALVLRLPVALGAPTRAAHARTTCSTSRRRASEPRIPPRRTRPREVLLRP